ncbi:hypothetical protein N656DRAFT_784115 [Canariomyces notabilis]|uniref:Uncharacterized protein n=1 Tax=Canariomyces notabilis TaxID=2074819 RepID=A0AAN6T9B2_9PEZI|nr:hypothetical protein N656DRAFT_784115 [Canariomyces arenarius]
MALRQKLSKPFVVEPTSEHTHTVVFLHRFPESVTDDELPAKVLSSKQTKNHKTLHEQFRGIRWVFPFPKTGAFPYANLSAADKAAVGLLPTSVPYITQILLQEAKVIGSLDKVILGGQGETAVAAHGAMSSFPEPRNVDVTKFMRDTLHSPSWTDIASDPRLAGFVGMHAEAREPTRDVTSYSIARKTPNNNPPHINTSIVANTPHCFIHGGYKVQTATWDGRRIDDFARFLAEVVGVHREVDPKELVKKEGREELTPRDRTIQPEKEKDDGLTEAQKYALEVAKEKKANEALAEKIKRRIEADKVERKIRQERERQAREAREVAGQRAIIKGEDEDDKKEDAEPLALQRYERPMWVVGDSAVCAGFNMYDHSEDSEDDDENTTLPRRLPKRRRKDPPGQRAAGDANWEAPCAVRGEMSEAQMRAFGLIKDSGPEGKKDGKGENRVLRGIKRERLDH